MARYFHERIVGDDLAAVNQSILLKRLLNQGLTLLRKSPWDEIAPDLEDMVRDFAVALLGREIDWTGESPYPSDCPNGIKVGESKELNEQALFDGLPPRMTLDEYERGQNRDQGSFYPGSEGL